MSVSNRSESESCTDGSIITTLTPVHIHPLTSCYKIKCVSTLQKNYPWITHLKQYIIDNSYKTSEKKTTLNHQFNSAAVIL